MSVSAMSYSRCVYIWLCCCLDLFLWVLWSTEVKHSERGRNPLKINLWCIPLTPPSPPQCFFHDTKEVVSWTILKLASVGPICMSTYKMHFGLSISNASRLFFFFCTNISEHYFCCCLCIFVFVKSVSLRIPNLVNYSLQNIS